jgi:hypothetical protein
MKSNNMKKHSLGCALEAAGFKGVAYVGFYTYCQEREVHFDEIIAISGGVLPSISYLLNIDVHKHWTWVIDNIKSYGYKYHGLTRLYKEYFNTFVAEEDLTKLNGILKIVSTSLKSPHRRIHTEFTSIEDLENKALKSSATPWFFVTPLEGHIDGIHSCWNPSELLTTDKKIWLSALTSKEHVTHRSDLLVPIINDDFKGDNSIAFNLLKLINRKGWYFNEKIFTNWFNMGYAQANKYLDDFLLR